ncbi:MAG: hypothetical protein GY849_08635 [Deltaproteobacteria bacterium]|nr:hypothetical protein [Deltaproteobacteria bacterium]
MKLWEIHKFCETAGLDDLIEKENQLVALIQSRSLLETNAQKALEIVQKYIELKRVLG